MFDLKYAIVWKLLDCKTGRKRTYKGKILSLVGSTMIMKLKLKLGLYEAVKRAARFMDCHWRNRFHEITCCHKIDSCSISPSSLPSKLRVLDICLFPSVTVTFDV